VWQELGREEAESIMLAPWPEPLAAFESSQTEEAFSLLQDLIVAVRNIRGEMNVPASKTADVLIAGGNGFDPAIITQHESYFAHLARVKQLTYAREAARPKLAATAVVKNFEVYVPLAGLIDVDVERERLRKEQTRLEKLLEGLNQRLQSEAFTAKAPKDVVEKERQKKAEFEGNLAKLENSLKQLRE
jgi:valyl-tRNA synthetase